MTLIAEPSVPDSVIAAFENRYRRTFDLAPFDGEWGNTHRYKHDGVQQRWEGWRDSYLSLSAGVNPVAICDAFAETMKPENADRYFSDATDAVEAASTLVDRLKEYAKDWRVRAADKSIVDEAVAAIANLSVRPSRLKAA